MTKKKVCMLGAFGVGKTSLVARFVKSLFSERYHSTIGVKIDKKDLVVNGAEVSLVLWDLPGEGEEDEFQKVRMSYLQGAAGYVLVVDGTRPETLETARNLQKRVEDTVGHLPFTVAVNKADLGNDWQENPSVCGRWQEQDWIFIPTSAKTGAGVEDLFQSLAERLVKG
ncbi:MAG: GTP-binding protein [Blastocatellia bacterium]|nr:GTP-binding protein [Blastocatellia bacterium]